jgi:glycosyltransferase involved in cell wall biosynthesis
MNIGIDARLLERKMTGIGRVLEVFLKTLPKIDTNNKYFLFSYEKLDFKQGKFYTNITTVKSIGSQKIFAPFWINFILPRYLKKNKIDLFFSINQMLPLVKPKGIKYIFTLHDVIYRVDKSFHPFIYRKYLQFFIYFSIKNSDLIITDSEYSKQDILKYYKIDQSKVQVVYSSANEYFQPLNLIDEQIKNVKEKYDLRKYNVLYVGMIENRKNIMGILKIADEILKINNEIGFILIGKIGYGGNKLLNEVKKRKNVIYLSNIDDNKLKMMYNVADIFLFPSFYEGFGFPPLEAMQTGIPVLSSNNTSLKEIVGNGGITHEAHDLQSFTKDIIKLLGDKNLYEEMRRRGFEQAKKFNIDNTVKELVHTFNSVKILV